MYISRIEIKNYRSWRDAKIDLPYDDKNGKTITLFSGKIAAGKTSLFNAIGWCLTGRESQELLGSKSHEKTIPRDSEFDQEGNNEVSVTLDILSPENPETRRMILQRKHIFKKNVIDPISKEIRLDIYSNSDVKTLSSSNPNDEIRIKALLGEIFPDLLSRFHLFDGEFLVQTYSERGTNIEGALKGMFKIGAIVRLNQILGSMWSEYSKKISKMKQSTKLDKLNGEHELAAEELNATLSKIESTGEEIDTLDQDIKELDKELNSLSEEKGKAKEQEELHKSLEGLKEDRENYQKNLDKLKLSLWKYTFFFAPKRNLIPEMEEASKLITKVEETGDIPAKIKETFVQDLIDKMVCICGTTLEPNSQAMENIRSYLEAGRNSERRAILLDLRPILNYHINQLESELEIINNKKDEIRRITNTINGLTQQIDSLVNVNFDEVSKKILRRYDDKQSEKSAKIQLRDKRRDLYNELRRKENNLKQQIEDLKEKISNESNKMDGMDELKSLLETTTKLQTVFNNIPERLLEEFAHKIEDHTNELIDGIPELSGKRAKVEISPQRKLDFHLEQNGTIAYLTGGESQIAGKLLIASFIKIVKDLREYLNVPFICMDHPFSNYDREARQYMPKKLSNLFSGAQIIMFLPNTEYYEFAENAKENLAKAYWLEKSIDGETKVTEVPTQ